MEKSIELTSNGGMNGQLLLKDPNDTVKKWNACLLAVEFITGNLLKGEVEELSQI